MKCPTCGEKVSRKNFNCHSCDAELPATAQQEIAATSEGEGKIFVVLGWVFIVLSLFALPIIFGPAAFVMGVLTFKKRSKTHGIILMVVSVLGLIIGMILGALMMMF